ncbi:MULTISPECIES: hypothetical protein [unclassified Microcoleus]|uniref:hypothetical protein n=1 Tax=unclassified Microcoleus TaxID=2642155 RepID=UPI0025E0ACAA|nr:MULTISPECIES: hypothetical protein [unclassified Microcoleus]
MSRRKKEEGRGKKEELTVEPGQLTIKNLHSPIQNRLTVDRKAVDSYLEARGLD